MKQYIIPVFIPYSGCPHRCIFCNQKKIAGDSEGVSIENIRKTVDLWLSDFIPHPSPATLTPTLSQREGERGARGEGEVKRQIAFYGGSFTALPVERQEEILSSVSYYLNGGIVDSLRLSTRPDSISAENLALLKRYGVKTVELGAQSMDDRVLAMSERGHSAEDVRNSYRLLKSYGFETGIQIMPGLPGDTVESSLYTADEIIKLKPDFVRIYPTVVIKDTGLADLYQKGAFKPLTLFNAIRVCKIMLMKFEINNIPVIRIGLQPTSSLIEKEVILDGPFHPALRQLIESEIAYDMMRYAIDEGRKTKDEGRGTRDESRHSSIVSRPSSLVPRPSFLIPPSELSNFIGQKRANLKRLESETGLKVDVKADAGLEPGKGIFDNGFKKIYIERKEWLRNAAAGNRDF
jgi:histone acetyltransferase (RNA polymerase elongator complex component)